jgi:ribosomal protein S18 acetylase RimI-like enzyme
VKKNALVVKARYRYIVGYEEFYNHHAPASFMGAGYVHPEYRGLGIGTTILRALGNRRNNRKLMALNIHIEVVCFTQANAS